MVKFENMEGRYVTYPGSPTYNVDLVNIAYLRWWYEIPRVARFIEQKVHSYFLRVRIQRVEHYLNETLVSVKSAQIYGDA